MVHLFRSGPDGDLNTSAVLCRQAADLGDGEAQYLLGHFYLIGEGVPRDPAEAARGAHAIYTDVWASMGAENEVAERRTAFADYQVDDDLFTHAAPDAVFMHCLPAKRGEEVTDSVIESPRSVVFDQAENRLHAQKALLLMLMS